MTAFYAIKNVNGKRHFFEWNKQDTFGTREQLERAIAEWKKAVTPSMASAAQFEIIQETAK